MRGASCAIGRSERTTLPATTSCRAQARRMKRRKMARRELKLRDPDRTVALCRPCHRNVHATLSNGDLGKDYDSLEALSAHQDVRRFTDWVRSKLHGQT